MMECSRETICRSLQKSRKAAGFKSAKALADRIGIKPTKYTEYEQGRARLPYETAWQIADVLGCTLDELGGREWPVPGSARGEWPDPRQRLINEVFESVNDEGKDKLADDADTMRASGKFGKKCAEDELYKKEDAA